MENKGEIELQKTPKEEMFMGMVPDCSCDTICGLSKQSKHKSELASRSNSSRKLVGLIIFGLLFIVVEVVGGVKANSLAVLTDAAHLLTDVAGFALSLFAVWASGWDATPRHSFGFFRVEVLGALLSVQLIWIIAGFLIYEAIDRIFKRNVVVNGKLMFLTAAFGFLINLLMVSWLGHDHSPHGCGHKEHCNHNIEDAEEKPLVSSSVNEHQCDEQVWSQSILSWILLPLKQLKQTHINMNVQSAYLHILGDLIQSVGVMIGGAVIWAKPNWLVVDLVCTLGFSLLVLLTTVSMVRDIYFVLMDCTPAGIDAVKLETGLKRVVGVRDVHDLHVWAISVGKFLLSCHVIAEQGVSSNEILKSTRDYCERVHGIHHVTIQIEQE
ncbi:Zinc transporter [Thalictrum thalictroides]|uniref:Zinc transporter n=1 Tax=Thalictrum thalictroides TaxID=46969 RepID=A0A7J6XD22_THATH|nr:Zinc transporter [Thalictrum thalictroides]